MKNPILSIVILNYNSGEYLSACLDSLQASITNHPFEVIIVDNNSTDSSANIKTKSYKLNLKIVRNKQNSGFSAGNNIGVRYTNPHSKYLLFLNPDTIVQTNTVNSMVNLFKNNPKVDAATCKIILAKTNQIQPECHRGFPTPWRSFCYFSGLGKLFPDSLLFSGYFLGHLDLSKTHPIEACVGAFLMVKRAVGNTIAWWNESYFFYGEDLDFCFKLYQQGFKLYYYPDCFIAHFQGISSGIKSQTKNLSKASRITKILSAKASTSAMRIFYQQNYYQNYSKLTKFTVSTGINMLELVRLFRARYL